MHKKIFLSLFFIVVSFLLLATVALAQNVQFITTLQRGSSGSDVARLQEFLKTVPEIYPEGLVTGYFGLLTEKAVRRFQLKYGIEQIGVVGPKTRVKINSLISPQIVGQQSQRSSSSIQSETKAPSKSEEKFAALENELLGAKTSGFVLGPVHYERIKKDLAALESEGYSAREIERLREIALKLAPHLQDAQKTQGSAVPVTTPPVNSQPGERGVTKKANKPMVLKNLGVSFEPWDKNTNRAGAFLFLPSETKLFLEYGAEVRSSEGGTKILPTFEYRTAKDADVFAASDGIVTKIAYQPQTQDYEILIQPEMYGEWTLGHDHVSNIRVSEGDNVKAGDVLGKVGTLGGALGRTEIMIWGGPASAGRPLTYCPFKLFAPELLSEYEHKVSQHMKDWEEFKGNPNLYSEEKYIFPGCAYESLFD